jgi:uncharacterized protein (DUF3820 family)
MPKQRKLSGECKMNGGMFSGRCIKDVPVNYLEWYVQSHSDSSALVRKIKDFLSDDSQVKSTEVHDYRSPMLDSRDIPPEEYEMPWGKYRGQELQYIAVTNISYLEWLLTVSNAEPCAEIQAYIQNVLEKNRRKHERKMAEAEKNCAAVQSQPDKRAFTPECPTQSVDDLLDAFNACQDTISAGRHQSPSTGLYGGSLNQIFRGISTKSQF